MKRILKYIFTIAAFAVLALPAASRFRYPGFPGIPQDTLVKAPELLQDTTVAAPAPLSPEMDSLRLIYQPMGLWDLDSMTVCSIDSTILALRDSIFTTLPDTNDIRKLKRRLAKEYRDSVRIATPRVLSTFAIPDSLTHERMMSWTADTYFNEIEMRKVDTMYNAHFYDYPFDRKDVGATYLGTSGSPVQLYNYFRREHMDAFPQFDPYLAYSYTPENLPQYNTKTPFTELAYQGTTFALKAKEESQVQLLTTQNINPKFNFTLAFNQYGASGMLQNEKTDNRTALVALNYLGKRYLLNAGYIGQGVKRDENGGICESTWVRDTVVDPKEIEVNLSKAHNDLRRRTYFLTQSYSIPMNFLRKDKDSLALGDGTMAFIGHSAEFSTYRKVYTDQISTANARNFYNNNFLINTAQSNDSLALTKFENKFFVKLQPFAPDAILSKINAGVGYQLLSYYSFDPSFYIHGAGRDNYSNVYAYAGASGLFRKYIAWDADGKLNMIGYNAGDMSLGGKVRLSLYPIKDGIHLTGKIRTTLTEPSPIQQKLYFNHHAWDNDFSKVSETRLEAELSIPRFDLVAGAGYALVDGLLYYDTQSTIQQCDKPLSILSAYLDENIRLGFLHLDNRALFQLSSDQEVLPLPKLALHMRYYVQFPVVKDAMDLQIGMDATYTTSFYAQAYSPDLGMFYNQTEEEIGNTPYFDAFVNAQWQIVSVFVKYTNALIGWPQADYFSAYHYIRPARGFKFGVYWPF